MPELPQFDGQLYLTDAGLETDLIFNQGHELPAFAAHTMLQTLDRRSALENYFLGFLELAKSRNTGFILDVPTWRAQRHFSEELDTTVEQLEETNRMSVEFGKELKGRYEESIYSIVLNGLLGPRGDAYDGSRQFHVDEAQQYHREQVRWLVENEVEMLTAMTVTHAEEAIGMVRAAAEYEIPIVVSFTVETDGRLPNHQSMADAIQQVDAATSNYTSYFMINCAHPDHFIDEFDDQHWLRRIRGFRCNASRKSHAELDASETLDAGDPQELALGYQKLKAKLPWANVFGGCCGSDLRHVTALTDTLLAGGQE